MAILIDRIRKHDIKPDTTAWVYDCTCCAGMRMTPPADLVEGNAPECSLCDGHGQRHYFYVGRAMPQLKLRGSVLGNPFRLGADGNRAECLQLYDGWLRGTGSILPINPGAIAREIERISVPVRQGRRTVLCCWCVKAPRPPHPEPWNHSDGCHADLVAKLILERLKG